MIARIYRLEYPKGNPRYVGYTVKTLEQRLALHMRHVRVGRKSHLMSWLKALPEPPYIVLIDQVDELEVDQAERYWIKYYRDQGVNLVNMTDGGRGTLGHRQSAEEKERRAAKLRGRVVPPEVGRKISTAKMGHATSDETRAKMRARKLGKPWTPTQRAAHEARHRANGVQPKPPISNPVFCDCRAGPFRGTRGLYRHREQIHGIRASGGTYL